MKIGSLSLDILIFKDTMPSANVIELPPIALIFYIFTLRLRLCSVFQAKIVSSIVCLLFITPFSPQFTQFGKQHDLLFYCSFPPNKEYK
jgi:hypothetical protein